MNKNTRNILIGALLLVAMMTTLVFMYNSGIKQQNTPIYSEIVELFDDSKVESFKLDMGSGALELKLNTEYKGKTTVNYNVANFSVFYNDVESSIKRYNTAHPDSHMQYELIPPKQVSWIVNLLPTLLLIGGMIFLWVFMSKKMGQAMGGDGKTTGFGKAKVKNMSDEKRRTTFADVAGADEEKEELKEVVDFLKDQKKFNALGARIPKGILLVGPPGTGKTLLARAVAGEAGVPFFSISGSDFVEMFVGVGASRVRDLFEQAKKNSPCIIFIDEIDAVGRHRGAGLGGGHDEREQTLNQLLVEMDGFGANEGVIMIAATNRPDILDPALMRPGRFDRQITVGYPDMKGRYEILKVHSKGKPLAPDVELKTIAKTTSGFTGADLENLLNEAALLSARKSLKAITMEEIEEATIKVVMGTEKRSHKVSEREKKITCYHEAGHAVSTYFLSTQDPVHQISIIPRGMAGGYTMSLPKEDRSYRSKKEMEESIVVLLGGRVAESLTLDDISTGASNDIERATSVARGMVVKYGMSEKLGPICFEGAGSDEIFLGKSYGHEKVYSESIAATIDSEIDRLIKEGYDSCRKILTEHMDKLHKVAEFLFRNEKMDGDQFRDMMEGKEVKDNDFNADTPSDSAKAE